MSQEKRVCTKCGEEWEPLAIAGRQKICRDCRRKAAKSAREHKLLPAKRRDMEWRLKTLGLEVKKVTEGTWSGLWRVRWGVMKNVTYVTMYPCTNSKAEVAMQEVSWRVRERSAFAWGWSNCAQEWVNVSQISNGCRCGRCKGVRASVFINQQLYAQEKRRVKGQPMDLRLPVDFFDGPSDDVVYKDHLFK